MSSSGRGLRILVPLDESMLNGVLPEGRATWRVISRSPAATIEQAALDLDIERYAYPAEYVQAFDEENTLRVTAKLADIDGFLGHDRRRRTG